MLPLIAEKTPATAQELSEALTRGLTARGITPRSVQATGTAFPKLDTASIDLTDSRLTRSLRLASATGETTIGVEIGRFEIIGRPIYLENTALDLLFTAEQVKLHIAGQPAEASLVTDSAATGSVSVQIAKDALEALIQSLAAEAAAERGLEVRKTALTFTQEGPRAVSFRADVTAKVFVMSATLSLSGRVDIDGELNARFHGLELGGDAMITKLAGSYVRPHLDRLEGRVFPLLSFSLGGLKLQDIELVVGPTIEIRAKLGNA